MKNSTITIALYWCCLLSGVSASAAQYSQWVKVTHTNTPPEAFKASKKNRICRARFKGGRMVVGYTYPTLWLCHIADGRFGTRVSRSAPFRYEVLIASPTTRWMPRDRAKGLINAGLSDDVFLGICQVPDGRIGWVDESECVVHEGQRAVAVRVSSFRVLADPDAERRAKAQALAQIPDWEQRLERILVSQEGLTVLQKRLAHIDAEIAAEIANVPKRYQSAVRRELNAQLDPALRKADRKIQRMKLDAKIEKSKRAIDAQAAKANVLIQRTNTEQPTVTLYASLEKQRQTLKTLHAQSQQSELESVDTYADDILSPGIKAINESLRYLERTLSLKDRATVFRGKIKRLDKQAEEAPQRALALFKRFYKKTDPQPVLEAALESVVAFGGGVDRWVTTIERHYSPKLVPTVRCMYGMRHPQKRAKGSADESPIRHDDIGATLRSCAAMHSDSPQKIKRAGAKVRHKTRRIDVYDLLFELTSEQDCAAIAKDLPRGDIRKQVATHCRLMKKEKKDLLTYCRHLTKGWELFHKRQPLAAEKAANDAALIHWEAADGLVVRQWRTQVEVKTCKAMQKYGEHEHLLELLHDKVAAVYEKKRVNKLMQSVPKFEAICKKQGAINQAAQKEIRRAASRGRTAAVEKATQKLNRSFRIACKARRNAIEVYSIYKKRGNSIAANAVWKAVPTCIHDWKNCE